MSQSNAIQVAPSATLDWGTLEKVVVQGDLAQLSSEQRVNYYRTVCESLGVNPATQPFAYITLNGKLTLYAKKDLTEQLRRLYGVSTAITARERLDDVYVVTARAELPSGRTDESIGAVAIGGLKGEALANAFMKAETKAKRRVTLSICGLGMLDETETETIAGAQMMSFDDEDLDPGDELPNMATPAPREPLPARYLEKIQRLADEYRELGGDPSRLHEVVKGQTGGKIGFGHLDKLGGVVVGEYLSDAVALLKASLPAETPA